MTGRPNIARFLPARDPREAARMSILMPDGSTVDAGFDLRTALAMQEELARIIHHDMVDRMRRAALRRGDWC